MSVHECILICGVIKLEFKKVHYTWDRYHEDLCMLSDDLQFEPSVIVGIARGGLVPAVQLSHLLGKPLLSVHYQTRDGGKKERIKIPEYALIVDDINDTGKTLTGVTEKVEHDRFATLTLFNKDTSIFKVDYFAADAKDDEWIVFPWE